MWMLALQCTCICTVKFLIDSLSRYFVPSCFELTLFSCFLMDLVFRVCWTRLHDQLVPQRATVQNQPRPQAWASTPSGGWPGTRPHQQRHWRRPNSGSSSSWVPSCSRKTRSYVTTSLLPLTQGTGRLLVLKVFIKPIHIKPLLL